MNYRILSVFKILYGTKWRYEQHVADSDSIMGHVQDLQFYFDAFVPTTKYYYLKLINNGKYKSTHITSENGSKNENMMFQHLIFFRYLYS